MFKLIPDWIIAAAFGLLLATLGVQTLRVYNLKLSIADTARETSRAITTALQAKIDADQQTRLRNEENERNHQMELDRLRTDLDALDSSRVSGSPELAPVIVRARKACPASPGPSKQAGDPIGVLTDLLGRVERREEIYARAADERGIAGTDCERRYDALPK